MSVASYWQFDPEGRIDIDGSRMDPSEAEVEAMPARVTVERTDDARVMVMVRGKPRKRYERHDSAWLEFDDKEAVALIADVAKALGKTP